MGLQTKIKEIINLIPQDGYKYGKDATAQILTKMREMVLSKEMLEVGRKAIEDMLIEWRDDRLSMFGRGNGLVIKEKDGRDSSIIRFGPEVALKIGFEAILKAMED